MPQKIQKYFFLWVDIPCPAKRGEFYPHSILAPFPMSHNARLERAFCVFTPKFSGHAVSGSNDVLSSIIKAQSDGTPVWQCSKPCHQATYDNEDTVRRMIAEQKAMRIPTVLIPHCPKCGRPMTMNLRSDDTFVQDDGWYAAAKRYEDFIRRHKDLNILYLELGIGGNTPGIIKYPFWQLTAQNPKATYACINLGECYLPIKLHKQSICIDSDIGSVLSDLLHRESTNRTQN